MPVRSIAASFPEPICTEILRQALETATSVEAGGQRDELLVTLVGQLLDSGRPQEANTAALAIGSEDAKRRAWIMIVMAAASMSTEPAASQFKAQACSLAAEIFVDRLRAKAWIWLAERLPAEQQTEALDQALAATKLLRDSNARDEILAELARRRVEAGQKAKAIQAVRDILSEAKRAEALYGVITELSESERVTILPETLTFANTIGDPDVKADLLVLLASTMPPNPELMKQALALARSRWNPTHRAANLTDLWKCVPEGERSALLRDLQEAVAEITSPEDQAEALIDIARQVDKANLSEIIARVREQIPMIKGKLNRARVLVGLADVLSPSEEENLFQELVTDLRLLEDETRLASALADLMEFIAEDQRGKTLMETWAMARALGRTDSRAEILTKLLPHVKGPQRDALLEHALAAVRETPGDWERTSAWGDILPHVAQLLLSQVVPEALQAVQELGEPFGESWKVDQFAKIVPFVPEPCLTTALDIVETIQADEWRAKALLQMAPFLSWTDLRRSLQQATGLQNGYWRAKVQVGLLAVLPAEERGELLRDILATVCSLESNSEKCELLGVLSEYCVEPERSELIGEALEAARSIEFEMLTVDAADSLIPHLPGPERLPFIEQVLGTVLESIFPNAEQFAAIARMTAYLPETERKDILAKLLDTAINMEWRTSRCEALIGLLPYLSEADQLRTVRQVVESVGAIRDGLHIDRWSTLRSLIPHLAALPTKELYPLWITLLHDLAGHERSDFCSDLSTLAPVLVALGGSAAALATAKAILDVGRWWP